DGLEASAQGNDISPVQNMITASFSELAWRSSDRCPSCKAPLVPTQPMDLFRALSAASSVSRSALLRRVFTVLSSCCYWYSYGPGRCSSARDVRRQTSYGGRHIQYGMPAGRGRHDSGQEVHGTGSV